VDSSIVVALIGVFSALVGSYLGYLQGQAKVRQDLQVEFDKNLRAERVESYKQAMKLMRKLPKYPEPIELTYEDLKTLSNNFTNWYFDDAGGLFLSHTSRDHCFDLQDGIKIILQKKSGKWGEVQINDTALRKKLDRSDEWKCPELLKQIAQLNINTQDNESDAINESFVENLRKLASLLRTSLTEDVMSRQATILLSSEIQGKKQQNR
jgi:hypothetical protein